MEQFDSLNQAEPSLAESILFVGSSSIRLWDRINEDMAPYPVIQRGYGGASFVDLAYYIDRLIGPHQFAAMVVFAGNDIWGHEDDRSPEEIANYLRHIISRAQTHSKETPIFVVEITHVPSRQHLIEEIHAANEALRKVCEDEAQVHWISTRQVYLTEQGDVDTSLFGPDNTHQNRTGYQLWTELIKNGIKAHLQ